MSCGFITVIVLTQKPVSFTAWKLLTTGQGHVRIGFKYHIVFTIGGLWTVYLMWQVCVSQGSPRTRLLCVHAKFSVFVCALTDFE